MPALFSVLYFHKGGKPQLTGSYRYKGSYSRMTGFLTAPSYSTRDTDICHAGNQYVASKEFFLKIHVYLPCRTS